MTDVKLFNTLDGGEITIAEGQVTMSPGLDVAVYLSLFGGNENDSALPDDRRQWWGNLGEDDPARVYRSQTQYLLARTPARPGNLPRVQDAVLRDLKWLTDSRIASSVRVTASIPGLNQIKIVVDIEAVGESARFEFTENWQASV